MEEPNQRIRLMRRVRVNGELRALPFANLFRKHTETESKELSDSIRDIWIQIPVVLYTSPTHGDSIIDGIGRVDKALEIDAERKIPTVDLGEITDEAAEVMARHLNKRRHLTPEELKELREKELKRIPELRRAGMSLRAIAKEVREHPDTVRKILNKPLVHQNTSLDENDDPFDDDEEREFHPAAWVDLENDAVSRGDYEAAAEYRRKGIAARRMEYTETPSRIKGRDGKSYPASTPRRTEPADDEMLSGLEIPSARDAIFEKLSRIFDEMRAELAALKILNEPIRKRDKQVLIRARNDITAALKSRLAGKRA